MGLFKNFRRTISEQVDSLKSALELIEPGAVAKLNLAGSIPQQEEAVKVAIAEAVGYGPTGTNDADLRSKLAQAEAERDQAKAENDRLKSEHKVQVDKLQKQLDELSKHTEDAIARRAMEIALTQGNVPPICFSASGNPGVTADKEKLWAEYRSLPPDEKNAFYKRNRDAMRD